MINKKENVGDADYAVFDFWTKKVPSPHFFFASYMDAYLLVISSVNGRISCNGVTYGNISPYRYVWPYAY